MRSRRASRPAAARRSCAAPGELAARYPDVWIQSHVAENLDEVKWARELFPASRSYLAIYDDFGLMRERAIYAHCIHFDDEDRALMRATGAAAAVSPTSNLFLGSGFFDYEGARARRLPVRPGQRRRRRHQLQPVPHHAGRVLRGPRRAQTKPGVSLSPQHLWWQHTAGAAQALGLEGVIGNLQPGCEADFLVLDPRPRRCWRARRRRPPAWTNCCSR